VPIKLTAVSRRRPGLTRAEYFRYIEHYHGTVARLERFKIDRYIQNHVLDGAFGVLSDSAHHNKVADRDGVVELHFSGFRDMLATLEPEGVTQSRANQDGRFFADEPTNIIVMAEETELPVANPRPKFNPGLGEPGVGALKVMQFIMRRPEVFPNDYYKLWRQAHDEALAAAPYAQEQFRKIVVSTRSRVNDNDAAARAHFRMVDPPVYDMVVSFWLDSMEQAGAFRQYVAALQETPVEFADWSESFYLYVRQVRIIDDALPKD
jgi:EthD domain